TGSHLGLRQIIPKVILLSKKLMSEHTITGIGISTAGIVDVNRGVVTGGADHIPGYSTIPIINRLQEVLKVPVSIEDDVNCAAL
ncbi:ROK family protein, partial [Vibrio cholerae]|nr:ROK family protein [Vibrio cholerae]